MYDEHTLAFSFYNAILVLWGTRGGFLVAHCVAPFEIRRVHAIFHAIVLQPPKSRFYCVSHDLLRNVRTSQKTIEITYLVIFTATFERSDGNSRRQKLDMRYGFLVEQFDHFDHRFEKNKRQKTKKQKN